MGSRKFVNDAGPCDTTTTKQGKNLFDTIVPDYVNQYSELNGVVYNGPVKSPQDIMADLLANNEFNDKMKSKDFTDAGAACACNPNDGVTCVLVFGKEVKETANPTPINAM